MTHFTRSQSCVSSIFSNAAEHDSGSRTGCFGRSFLFSRIGNRRHHPQRRRRRVQVTAGAHPLGRSLRACNKTPTERRQLRHLLLIGDLHMACVLVPDALWNLIEPLLPIPSSKPQGGRPRLADRACLAGVILVLRSGIPWRMLPKALGCGSGMTCWRRLRDWQQDGIWDLIHFALLDYLSRDGQIDWSRAVIDSCSVRAVFGGG